MNRPASSWSAPHRDVSLVLRDHRLAPARQLVMAYRERWEIENGFAELKNRLRGAAFILRSKVPESGLPGDLRPSHRLPGVARAGDAHRRAGRDRSRPGTLRIAPWRAPPGSHRLTRAVQTLSQVPTGTSATMPSVNRRLPACFSSSVSDATSSRLSDEVCERGIRWSARFRPVWLGLGGVGVHPLRARQEGARLRSPQHAAWGRVGVLR
ncbi:transposase [Streptomyces sp. NPDC002205]|uniref:transposase n=1 Tax=Streptomyces sp. NPDC002205 TaxID=3154411 RepID=UPI003322DCCB